MPYTQLYYHIVFGTKNRLCLLTPKVEKVIHTYLRMKATGLGAIVFALNGTEDHVHIVVSIPPKIAVAKFIGQIKAVASAKYNKEFPDSPVFFWQAEYGVFTFDRKRLAPVIAYVENQKKHHACGEEIPILERILDVPGVIREITKSYETSNATWLSELEDL